MSFSHIFHILPQKPDTLSKICCIAAVLFKALCSRPVCLLFLWLAVFGRDKPFFAFFGFVLFAFIPFVCCFFGFFSFFCRRYCKDKLGIFTPLAFNMDIIAAAVYKGFYDIQTDTCPFGVYRTAGVRLVKTFKYIGQCILFNAVT